MHSIITTVNVNGIRAAAKKGFLEWIDGTESEVVCLQEVRAEAGQFDDVLARLDGWHGVWAPAAAKGRAGVAVLSRRAPEATRIGFGSAEFDSSGRYAELDLPGLTVASLYLPSGEVGTARQDEKERFMAEFLLHLGELRARAAAEGREVVVCGDWNIAHREADLRNWKANQKKAGFLPEERAWFSRVLDDHGYVDVLRHHHPDQEGPYSWWSYRGRAFDNDAGWRIDAICTSPGIATRCTNAYVERPISAAARWSDHAPVTAVFEASA